MDELTATATATPGADVDGDDVERIDVEPVNKPERRELYAKRPRIHPKKARGAFRRVKWLVMAATLAVYYVAPWLRWDRGPTAPDQAVLLDFPARRFYFFFIEIWPQEIYYITGLLIIAGLSLFLVTSLAGRLWCGYTCPQTVWTDLFIAVERLVEGDRNARIRLDRASWGAAKTLRKIVKHAIWIVISVCTGGAWVFYYADAPTLAVQLLAFDAPAIAYIFAGAFALTTYTLGALAREQVCTYMCPWPRIQGAMLDEESLVVGYHPHRGEPRGAHKRGDPWEGRGHCIDCNQCVAVCPMGIDIRDGLQLECISCALCIDACNGVMDKVGLQRGLIGYDTLAGVRAMEQGEAKHRARLVRPRTVFYAAGIALTGLVMLVTLVGRSDTDINLLKDRNPLFVRLSDGSIRNGYTLKIINKRHDERRFTLRLDGLAQAAFTVVGAGKNGRPDLVVPADKLRAFRVYVRAPRKGASDFRFVLTDRADGVAYSQGAIFQGPSR